MALITSQSVFRELTEIPLSPEDVIWGGLEPNLYQDCIHALEALTISCQSTATLPTSFFVGAGISAFRPSCLPIAKDVLKALFDLAGPYCHSITRKHLPLLMDSIEQGKYVMMESVFQQLFQTIPQGKFQSGRIFDVPAEPPNYNINHLFLARWLQSGRGTVVTTNLDPLIEHAWNSLLLPVNTRLTTVKRPEQFGEWAKSINKSNVIWKLHGSGDDPNSWAITLSKVGIALDDARVSFLKDLIYQHNICFVGYRAADLDLFPPIRDAHTDDAERKGIIYWVFYFQEGYKTLTDYLATEENIRHLFEKNRNRIRPIITTAERLTSWLDSQCLSKSAIIQFPPPNSKPYEYQRWLKDDLISAGYFGVNKLVGVTLRTVDQHDAALAVLDALADEILSDRVFMDNSRALEAAQFLQESAQTSWQRNRVKLARKKVEHAWQLLKSTGSSLDKAWCQFGRVSMTLDAKTDVPFIDYPMAVVRLLTLHSWFDKLRYDLSSNKSPIIGKGLCIYYEAKLAERISGLLKLLKLKITRRLLLHQYNYAEQLFRDGQFPQSIPDIKRRKSFLLLPDEPQLAVVEMIDALRIAQVIGSSHYQLTQERANQLADQIGDETIRKQLMDSLNWL